MFARKHPGYNQFVTREDLQELMRKANTLEEINQVKRLVDAWLRNHPGDTVILSEMESVIMVEEGLLILQSGVK